MENMTIEPDIVRLQPGKLIELNQSGNYQMTGVKVHQVQNLSNKKTDGNKTRLDLLDKICRNERSIKPQLPVISGITQMTRYALNASASSLLLMDRDNTTLIYKFADGPLGKQFTRLQAAGQLGIAGWVMRTGQHLIIKNVSEDARFNKSKGEITGLETRSVICAPLVVQGVVIGVIEALNKLDGNDFSEHDLATLDGLVSTAAMTIENIILNESLLHSYKDTVQKLVSELDTRETNASVHSKRVAEYANIAATELSLSEEDKQTIAYGAILHDIGLLGIPARILNKREALTGEEWNMIHKHPVIGYNLLRGIPSLNQVSKLVLYHHERFDGKGYPSGLKGEAIPMGARILAVADAFVSMTTKHTYRDAFKEKDAGTELGRNAGSQFCPTAVKAFRFGLIKAITPGDAQPPAKP
jgi:HD-GYP domain-containing protein (c-di-GMP phosphodiesterase class II)